MSAEDRARKVKDDLDNCLKTIKEKKNDVGLVASDLVPLLDKILLARKFNSPILAESLIEAERCSRLYDTHVSVGVALRAAVNAKDRVRLRALITDVVNMKIKTEAFEDARIMMKQLEAEYKEAKASGVLAAAKEDPSEVKRRNKEASYRDERFDIKNFPGLRNPNEYAKAVLLDKAEMKAKFLLWQSIMIPKSLTELALEDNRTAMDTHLEVLKFCNDRVATQPAVIAQGILQKGFDNDALRDEIFMQLVKQVSGNPRQESEDRGWQLLCMVSGTFPPSIVLEGYLVHWLLEKIEKVKGFGVNYALYTLRSIQAAVDNREQKCVVPTVEEILAYKLRPPVSVSVELVNGFPVTSELPVAPDVTVGTLLELCQAWMGLTDPRSNTLGLFVYDLGPEEGFVEDPKTTKLKRSPAPTKITDFVGDIFAHRSKLKRKFRLVLKRRIFFPHHHVRGPDHVFEQLTYLQAEEAALVDGHIMVDDDDKAFALASMSIAVAYRDNLGFSVGEIVDAGIQKYVAPDFRANKTPQEWAAMVLEMRDTLVSTDAEDLQDSFLQICQANLFYGKFWFYVHRVEPVAHTIYPDTLRGIPTDLILGFGHDGMLVCDHTHSRYGLFPYGDIFRWSGTESEMTLVLAEASLPDAFEFNILTSQSADIEATILDHIRTTMAEQAAIQNTTF